MIRPAAVLALFACSALHPANPSLAQDTAFLEATILRPVHVRRPAVRVGNGAPLLVALHGRGGSGQGMMGIWDVLREPKPVLVAPDAPYPLLLNQAKPAMGWSWDFPSKDRELWARADPLVVDFILSVIKTASEEHGTSGVYLLGHSQGVAYAYMAAAREPMTIRGVAAYAGILPLDLIPGDALRAAAGQVQILIAHGKDDTIIGIERSQKARTTLEEIGFSVTFRELAGGHTLSVPLVREVQAWINACEKKRQP